MIRGVTVDDPENLAVHLLLYSGQRGAMFSDSVRDTGDGTNETLVTENSHDIVHVRFRFGLGYRLGLAAIHRRLMTASVTDLRLGAKCT